MNGMHPESIAITCGTGLKAPCNQSPFSKIHFTTTIINPPPLLLFACLAVFHDALVAVAVSSLTGSNSNSGQFVTGLWRTGTWWSASWSRLSLNTWGPSQRTTTSCWYDTVTALPGGASEPVGLCVQWTRPWVSWADGLVVSPADGTSTEHAWEPRVHGRDHVWVLQCPGALHCCAGESRQRCTVRFDSSLNCTFLKSWLQQRSEWRWFYFFLTTY